MKQKFLLPFLVSLIFSHVLSILIKLMPILVITRRAHHLEVTQTIKSAAINYPNTEYSSICILRVKKCCARDKKCKQLPHSRDRFQCGLSMDSEAGKGMHGKFILFLSCTQVMMPNYMSWQRESHFFPSSRTDVYSSSSQAYLKSKVSSKLIKVGANFRSARDEIYIGKGNDGAQRGFSMHLLVAVCRCV